MILRRELTTRQERLIIFALGRLDNLMGLIGQVRMSEEEFTKHEIRELAKELGAAID